MKFEQVLRIYWSKGVFYNSKLHSFDISFRALFRDTKSFNWALRNLLINRFESYLLKKSTHHPISDLEVPVASVINVIFAQITNINGIEADLHKSNAIRLYLIKTTRGRSQALGKPSRGQRTWSNAWNAYKMPSYTRNFISEYQKILQKEKKEEKKDYKRIKRLTNKKPKKRGVSQEVKKVNFWF